jgi:SAM-dependent methyltransferase
MTNVWMGGEGIWDTDLYQGYKQENFDILDKYLETPPLKILDIGCGLAWESRHFYHKYGSELWLLDGDIKNNEVKQGAGDGGYHSTADNFLFYHPLTALDTEFKKANIQNYHLIDCNNINISEDVKFDLITSWVSCGFHYPVNTYRDLILKHSHKNTKVIMDLRIRYKKAIQPVKEEGVEILKVIAQRNKYIMAELTLS